MKTSLTSLCSRMGAAAVLLACAQSASAHAHPRQETPGPGQSVGPDTKQVSIEFDDALEPAFSSIKVTDATGGNTASGKSSIDPNDKKHMTVSLRPLKPGVYTVAWVAVAADGHRTQGHYNFLVK